MVLGETRGPHRATAPSSGGGKAGDVGRSLRWRRWRHHLRGDRPGSDRQRGCDPTFAMRKTKTTTRTGLLARLLLDRNSEDKQGSSPQERRNSQVSTPTTFWPSPSLP